MKIPIQSARGRLSNNAPLECRDVRFTAQLAAVFKFHWTLGTNRRTDPTPQTGGSLSRQSEIDRPPWIRFTVALKKSNWPKDRSQEWFACQKDIYIHWGQAASHRHGPKLNSSVAGLSEKDSNLCAPLSRRQMHINTWFGTPLMMIHYKDYRIASARSSLVQADGQWISPFY